MHAELGTDPQIKLPLRGAGNATPGRAPAAGDDTGDAAYEPIRRTR